MVGKDESSAYVGGVTKAWLEVKLWVRGGLAKLNGLFCAQRTADS